MPRRVDPDKWYDDQREQRDTERAEEEERERRKTLLSRMSKRIAEATPEEWDTPTVIMLRDARNEIATLRLRLKQLGVEEP